MFLMFVRHSTTSTLSLGNAITNVTDNRISNSLKISLFVLRKQEKKNISIMIIVELIDYITVSYISIIHIIVLFLGMY